MFLTVVGAVAAIFGGLRFLWSGLLDYKFTYKQVYCTLCSVQFFCALLLYPVTVSNIRPLFFIVVCISIFCEGGHFALVPSHCGYIFGAELGIQVYSFIFSCFGLSSLTGSILAKFIIKDPHSYLYIFIIAAALNVLCLVLLYFYQPLKTVST
jgi:predicted MFS family arabinose efflux permease